jgi:hypothetical protein
MLLEHSNKLFNVLAKSGYMTSEYTMECVFSIMPNIYNFGVLLLEVITSSRRSFINSMMFKTLLSI